ncbi:Ribonuclease H-like protein, partial [Dioscorea alata]
NTEKNDVTYDALCWITEVGDAAIFIRNFIMNHSMRLEIFNAFVTLKLFAIAETFFALVIIMLKRFKLIKRGLQTMVISEEWCSYKEDDVSKATKAKEIILNDSWWDKVGYIFSFTTPIYDMLWVMDTNKPTLHLVYEMWNTMIEKVKKTIYIHEHRQLEERSTFYEVIYAILIDRWTKSSTPLHCMGLSLNPRYYSNEWLNEVPNRLTPHRDAEI